jgi:hypothetical protein
MTLTVAVIYKRLSHAGYIEAKLFFRIADYENQILVVESI